MWTLVVPWFTSTPSYLPHFLPHYLPQWGKWGICFILPHFLYIEILWYLYFKNFQEFLEFSVISWYVIYACCGLILTLNKLIWLVRIIFKIPHFLPHYLPQWGKWGICFILPHFFIYILRRWCTERLSKLCDLLHLHISR